MKSQNQKMKKVLNFLIENLFLYNIIFNKFYLPMQKVIISLFIMFSSVSDVYVTRKSSQTIF